MKVKVLFAYPSYYTEDYGDIYRNSSYSDWEDIDEKDLRILQSWVHDYNRTHDEKAMILKDKDFKVEIALSEFLNKIKDENKAKEEKEKRQAERKAKKELKLAAKKKEEELALLRTLQEKWKNEIDNTKS